MLPLRPTVCAWTKLSSASTSRLIQRRLFHQSSLLQIMSPPAHKMAVFERATSALPSEYSDFRTVLWTGQSSQLVAMTIPVGGEIGEEAIVAGEEKEIKAGDLVIVPQGTKHNFVNTGPTPLCLFTVYAPAEHAEDTVHKTKEEGDKEEEEGRDEPPKWAKN